MRPSMMSGGGVCWAMSLHMEVCWQPNISPRSSTHINRWSRFASNGRGASLRRFKKKTLATLGGCVWDKQEQAKNMAVAMRGWERTLEHHNQVRRGEQEEEVKANLSRFLRSDWSVLKLVIGGSNVLGLALNLASSLLTLSASIHYIV
jgi:hypothetical protein